MTKNTNHIDPAKIHLKYIEVLYDDIGKIEEGAILSSIDTKVAHISAYNISENAFLFGLKAVLTAIEIGEQPKCDFRVNFHFEIDNLEDMFKYNEDDIPLFEELFVATIAGISYSTLRGVIFAKTNNTPWNGILLPIINPSLLLQSWIEQE